MMMMKMSMIMMKMIVTKTRMKIPMLRITVMIGTIMSDIDDN